jgi:hypothetical protein
LLAGRNQKKRGVDIETHGKSVIFERDVCRK